MTGISRISSLLMLLCGLYAVPVGAQCGIRDGQLGIYSGVNLWDVTGRQRTNNIQQGALTGLVVPVRGVWPFVEFRLYDRTDNAGNFDVLVGFTLPRR